MAILNPTQEDIFEDLDFSCEAMTATPERTGRMVRDCKRFRVFVGTRRVATCTSEDVARAIAADCGGVVEVVA